MSMTARKPKTTPPKTSTFAARVDDELRADLEAEYRIAKAGGWARSISDTAGAMLRRGLDATQQGRLDDPTRKFCGLIEALAENVVGMRLDGKPLIDWTSDPFMFQAFKLALEKVLDAMQPSGAMRSPLDTLPHLKG